MSGSPAPHDRAMLVALTPEASAALGAHQRTITRFPYRVGRESRDTERTPQGSVTERRDPGSRPANDLYLRDREEPLNVSREHFAIDRRDTGYVLVDCKSTCGTLVEGETVGGEHKGGTVALRDSDVIIVGTSLSPYVFKFPGSADSQRITVYDVLGYFASGMSEAEILRDFPDLTLDDRRACPAFAADRERKLDSVPPA